MRRLRQMRVVLGAAIVLSGLGACTGGGAASPTNEPSGAGWAPPGSGPTELPTTNVDYSIDVEDSAVCALLPATLAADVLGEEIVRTDAFRYGTDRESCSYATESARSAFVATYPAPEFEATVAVCGDTDEVPSLDGAVFEQAACGLLAPVDDRIFIQVKVVTDPGAGLGGERDLAIEVAQEVLGNAR